ncbi:unnamed protein product [Linum trigynum]|uniref:Uncharacterized protein n=2 Tax=Linum trigynum TaxID=586398 RepID=A0AAV2FWU7_9ROSI
MAAASKTRNMLEGFVKDGSFKWLLGKRTYFDEDFEEMGSSPYANSNWIAELSPLANVVVRRCSKILETSPTGLQESFNAEASDSIKHPSRYARNFLEYCCFRTLAVSIQVVGHLGDKKFRRLAYDMMLAWEAPAASSQPLPNADEDPTVGLDAFSRIAPAVPLIANVVISENLFQVLTVSTDDRLQFSIFDKYLSGLERAVKRMKSQSDSSLLADVRSAKRERILEVDGTVTTQPVLEHVGVSTWPGRLTLTDHALYFEALRVVSYETPKVYDLSEDLKQVVKPELTGPWGTRLFDKAVFYSSNSLSEPAILEFPELKGHTRRDYWLAIIREILLVHKFIKKFQILGVTRDEALSKAVLGILRLQAIQELSSVDLVCHDDILMFNLCEQLPGGDLILRTLANMSLVELSNQHKHGGRMYSASSLAMVSGLGFVFGTTSSDPNVTALVVGEVAVGEMGCLEKSVRESKDSYKKVVVAQATVDGVKVDGLDTNLAVMKDILLPVLEVGKWLLSLLYWDAPKKSFLFCLFFSYVIWRDWLGYASGLMFASLAVFMLLTRFLNRGQPVNELKVIAPPPMNTMEQLLAVQNAISQVEQLIQDGNIGLLKVRALLLSVFPQASDKFAAALLGMGLVLAIMPLKLVLLLGFLEVSTRHSPSRKESSERCARRMREWWFSIPAAPVVLDRDKDDKKKK